MKTMALTAILIVLTGCAVTFAQMRTASNDNDYILIVDGEVIGTIDVASGEGWSLNFSDNTMRIKTNEVVYGCQQGSDIIFDDRFEALLLQEPWRQP